ncbi:PASTA domain-containing protein [Brevibacillus humidisoli]|uniref:penicillin-binding protein n=1 Tax=Brevibacillus humidisoli TaxID=2895522 RepID=UPI001E32EF7B|nr:PASTA domain-containing penicillin-binding protein [Brevibacillus humidisoli]UFJ41918.1 PASTA domain-containing protein [Brevibacillus humidisoli]
METKQRLNIRTLCLGISLLLLFSGLIGRLWWIQSVDAAWIMEKGKKQWERERILQPRRGSILDRNGHVLAYEGKAYKVEAQLKQKGEEPPWWMNDNYVKDPYDTALKLAPILDVPVEKLVKYLTADDVNVTELGANSKKITEEQKEEIYNLQYPIGPDGKRSEVNQLPGIVLHETTRRYYPNNDFAAHVLGYLNYDDTAMMGIELQFDPVLRGEKGELQVIQDAAGYPLPQGERKYKPAKDGKNVVLTLDQQIQDYVEQALDKTVEQYNPKRATVIVSDPQSGEILAMATRPQFDPNDYGKIQNHLNYSISMNFEPGSTFKIITLAAAIEEGLFHPEEDYQSGSYTKVPGKPINDHNNGQGWGRISFLEGVQRSSNVAFVILGYERLQQKRLYEYFKRFGIGQETGIELPGEEEGIMRDLLHPNSPRDVAVTTFGQGVAVTAIQQVAAVGAIANGGELLKPQIVKELRDPHTGQVVQRNQREVVRRVVSEETSKQVRDILETVVTGEHGTGKEFKVEGYRVAGKTGTAQKYDPKTGEILPGSYIASFIGFAPKDDPRLLVYVVIDEPEAKYEELGRYVVAPVFKSVMESSLLYLQQQPELTESKAAPIVKEEVLPNFVGMAASVAKQKAQEAGFQAETIGTGTKIVSQSPGAFEKVLPNSKVTLVTDRVEGVRMPDFTGESLREVMEFAAHTGLQVSVAGSGFVTEQSIKPGTVLSGQQELFVTLVPASGPPGPATGEENDANDGEETEIAQTSAGASDSETASVDSGEKRDWQ